jgi:PKD repeat protein
VDNGVWEDHDHTFTLSISSPSNCTTAAPTSTTITITEDDPVPVIPTADFHANATIGVGTLCVLFTDDSTGCPASWAWNFGGDEGNSTSQNPVHTYTSPGTYTVTLTVSNVNGTSSYQRAAYITAIAPTSPISTFSVNVTSGVEPLCVGFTDTSTGYPTAWQWQMGDGSPNETSQNAVHLYNTPGVYKVNMTASNANGTGSTYQATITVIAKVYPVAEFIASATDGAGGLNVQFTDQSTGYPSSWQWSFGDGSPNSTDQDPAHAYSPGTYTVILTVSNANGTSVMEKVDYIHVLNNVPVVSFSANLTAGYAPLAVQFTGSATNDPTAWAWDLDGDGENESTEQNPVCVYATSGYYTITLYATNDGGTGLETKTEYIHVYRDIPEVYFSAAPTSGIVPLTVQFTDESTNDPSAWYWDLDGDGENESTEQHPMCTYPAAGTYTVRLYVANDAGDLNFSEKTDYITVSIDVPDANFTANRTTIRAGQAVQFWDNTTGGPDAWSWNFGDNTLNDTTRNPVHQFWVAGNYTVALYASNTLGGDTLERVAYIHVVGTAGSGGGGGVGVELVGGVALVVLVIAGGLWLRGRRE